MSLDIDLIYRGDTHSQNITHNIGNMAEEAGIYKCLWHPETNGFKTASQLIDPLEKALVDMYAYPAKYTPFSAENGWGTYRQFLPWLEQLLEACKEHPEAEIEVSR